MSIFDEFDAQEAKGGDASIWDEFDAKEPASQAASALAKRRWEKLTGQKATADRAKDAPALQPTGPDARSMADWERQQGAFGDLLTGRRSVPVETDPSRLAALDAIYNDPNMKGAIPGNLVTSQDEPSTLKRAGKNLPASMGNFLAGTALFVPQLAANPREVAGETVTWIKDAFKALGEGTALNVISHYNPVLGAQMRAQGWTDEALKQQFGDDPLGFAMAIATPALVAKGGAAGVKKVGKALDKTTGVPRAGDFAMEAGGKATTPEAAAVKKAKDIKKVIDDAEAIVELFKFEQEQNRPRTFETENAAMRAADRARIIAGPTPETPPLVEGQPRPTEPPILRAPAPAEGIQGQPAVKGAPIDPATGLPADVGPTGPTLLDATGKPVLGGADSNRPAPRIVRPNERPRGKGGVTLGTGLGGAQDLLTIKKVKEIVEQARIGNWSRRQIDEHLRSLDIDPTQFDDAIRAGRGERAPDLPLTETATTQLRDVNDLLDRVEQRKGELQQVIMGDDSVKGEQAAAQLNALLDHEGKLKDVMAETTTPDIDTRLAQAEAALADRLKKIGTSLQSGGLGDIPGVSKALFEVAYWQARKLAKTVGTVDFDKWAAETRKSARQEGFPVTDDSLRAIWDSATFGKEFRAPATPTQVANATATALEQGKVTTTADALVDNHTTTQIREWAARRLGPNNPLGIDLMDYGDRFARGIRKIADSHVYTLPRMGDIAKRIPRMVDSATRFITSKGHAFVISREHFDRLSTFLEVKNKRNRIDQEATKANRNLFADLLEDDRARALEARGIEAQTRRAAITTGLDALGEQVTALKAELKRARRANDLRTVERLERDQRKLDRDISALEAERTELPPTGHGRYRKMADAARQAALARPDIQSALQYYRDTIMPEMATMSTEVGINARLVGPLGTYIRMKWVVDPKELPQTGRDRAPQTYGFTASPGANSPFNVRPRKSASRNRSTGLAPDNLMLENDLFNMLNNTFADRLTVKAMQELRDMVQEHAIGTTKDFEGRGEPIPIMAEVGGRREPVVSLTLERVKGPADITYLVPESVKAAYDLATNPTEGRLVEALDTARSALTVPLLIVPAEAVIHGLNIISAVQGIEFYRKYGHTARVAEAMAGLPGKIATLLYKAYNLEGAELAKFMRSGAEGGGLRLSGFERTTEQRSILMAAAHKVPGLHALKELVFGHPGYDKGFKGLETRARAVLYYAIKEADPTLSDIKTWRLVNDAWGTYVNKLTPPMARTAGALYPFARARVALTKTGLKTMMSRDVQGQFNPYVMGNVAASAAGLILLVKALDDKKRWPWQIPGYKAGDVRFQYDDKIVTIPFNLVMNSLYRGMAATGMRNEINAHLQGETSWDGLTTATQEGMFNYLASFAGPVITTGSVLATGTVPYRTGGQFLTVDKPAMTGAPEGKVKQRAKAAFKQVMPVVSKGMEYFDPTAKEVRPTGKGANILYTVAEYFGVAPKLENAATAETRAASSLQRRAQVEWSDVAISIASEASRLPDDQRIPYIMAEVEKRATDTLVPNGPGGALMPANVAALQLAIRVASTATGRYEKAAAIQQMNFPNDLWQEFEQQEAVMAGGEQ